MGILICGLNGSGKSTLGKTLADRMGYEFIDNEDLFFPKTDPLYPFSGSRSEEEVIRLLEEKISANHRFIFAAVRGNYGDKLIASLDHIVLIEVPKQIRSRRVRDRSFQKFGNRILPGGDLYEKESKWFSFADSRPDAYVTEWLETLDCPVIRIDGTLPVDENVNHLAAALSEKNGPSLYGYNQELVIYSNCGHNVDTEMPEELADEADRFLKRTGSSGTCVFPEGGED